MSKKLFLLLILFFFLVGGLIITLNYAKHIKKSTTPQTQAQINPTINLSTTSSSLSLLPQQLLVAPGNSTSLTVYFNHSGASPSLVQFELAYDPSLLTNVNVIPGDFFEHSRVLLQTIDEHTGRISYAIESSDQNSKKTEGSVAIVTFTPQYGVLYNRTSLTFLPKTFVRTTGETNTLKTVNGATVIIEATTSGVLKK